MAKSFADRLFNLVRIAERYEVTKKTEYLGAKSKLKHERMLDLGCGDGTALFYLYKKMAKHVVGVDLNKDKLKQAKVFGEMMQLNCSMINADASHLPFKECTFNLIFSNCVLEHVPDDEMCFEDINRILLSGGELIATVPNLNEVVPAPCVKLLFEKFGVFKSKELSCFQTFDQALPAVLGSRWKQVRRGYSMNNLQKLLERKNFRLVSFSFFQTGVCRFFHNLAVSSRLDDIFPANFVMFAPVIHIFKFYNNGPEGSCAELAFKVVKV
jgi:ubiquinone/menaquinone biosynthesis C-methylase UbiE